MKRRLTSQFRGRLRSAGPVKYAGTNSTLESALWLPRNGQDLRKTCARENADSRGEREKLR